MIASFRDRDTAALFDRRSVRRWRMIERVALRKLVQIDAAIRLEDLRDPPGDRLEALHGDRAEQYSIRVNDQWRICFHWKDGDAQDVEIVDYH